MMTSVEVVRQMAAGKQVLLSGKVFMQWQTFWCVGNIKKAKLF